MAQMPTRKCKKWFCGQLITGKPTSLGYNAAKVVVSHGAGTIGGGAGVTIGAAIGSAIFPGIGTAIGSFIGGLTAAKVAKGWTEELMEDLEGEIEFEFTCPKCGKTWKETIIL